MVQQSKETGLQDVIISLSEGNDEDVEIKMQEHLKSVKGGIWPLPNGAAVSNKMGDAQE